MARGKDWVGGKKAGPTLLNEWVTYGKGTGDCWLWMGRSKIFFLFRLVLPSWVVKGWSYLSGCFRSYWFDLDYRVQGQGKGVGNLLVKGWPIKMGGQ